MGVRFVSISTSSLARNESIGWSSPKELSTSQGEIKRLRSLYDGKTTGSIYSEDGAWSEVEDADLHFYKQSV